MSAVGLVRLELRKEDGRIIPLAISVTTTEVWIRTKPLDFGDASVRKALQRLIMDITNRALLSAFTITISTADNLEDAFVEETAIEVDNLDKPINIRPRNSRYYKFEFADAQATTIWKLGAIEVLGTIAGKKT